jgi:glutamine synthetase
MTDAPRWIRVSFIDVFGATNSVQIPGSRWPAAVADGIVFDGSALEGRARLLESDMLLRPVEATLVVTGGVGRAIGEVLTTSGEPWPGDPRIALAIVVHRLGDLAVAWRAMAELEFYLFGPSRTPVDRGFYFDAVEGRGIETVRRAADALSAHGIDVQSCHHEAGPGQYEIDLAPLPALQLADAITLAKQFVRESAAADGLQATFMARPLEGEAGSGLHLHQTADHELSDAFGVLTPTGRAFVAGQLRHAAALVALGSPTVNSYKRLHGTGEAPGAAMWSHRHRAALIRVSASGIEYRGSDPSANPYLLTAGLLLAGADGIDESAELGPAQDESIGGFDASRDSVRYEPLPRTLDDALDALMADDVIVDGFDDALLNRLVDGRRAEATAYRQHVTTWEVDRYIDGA